MVSDKYRNKAIIIFNGCLGMSNFTFNDALRALKGVKHLDYIDKEFRQMFMKGIINFFDDTLSNERLLAIVELMEYNRMSVINKIKFNFKKIFYENGKNKF